MFDKKNNAQEHKKLTFKPLLSLRSIVTQFVNSPTKEPINDSQCMFSQFN